MDLSPVRAKRKFPNEIPAPNSSNVGILAKAELYITYIRLASGRLVKYQITSWQKNNTTLDYNAPCQKNTGFFFFSVSALNELIGMGKCSELYIILDLWLNTVYKDDRIQGSDIDPVVYYRDYTGNPFTTYTELAERWHISRSTVSRILNKLSKQIT